MKIRSGFVSNSSSSSFILIASGKVTPPALPANFTIGEAGCHEFGWQQAVYMDFESKVNFAYLQAQYAQKDANDQWMIMLQDILRKCGVEAIAVSVISGDYDDENYEDCKWAYIDHQSAYCDGQNCEMFDSSDSLRSFLFHPRSYIQCDNDNH